jgi:hypothetical protein
MKTRKNHSKAKARRGKGRPVPKKLPQSRPTDGKTLPASASLGVGIFGYLLAAWVVILAGLFALHNYNYLLQPGTPLIHNDIPPLQTDNLFQHLPAWIVWVGFAALVYLWRFVPAAPEDGRDISPWTARVLFWFFMGLGAFLRFEKPEDPVCFFWDDHYIHTSDIRNILDFHQFYFLFPSGFREPLFPYFTALLWTLMPHLTGLIVMLISNTLIDLAALWVFYLVGKEIGGRRMGIILLAMGAICKTMVMVTKFEYGNDTCVLGGALAILFFLRVLKKPDWKHFVQWGLALGFGGYTYVPFRPWMPVFLGAAWLWVFNDPKERRMTAPRAILGPGLLAAWAFLFLYKNSFLPEGNGLINFLSGPVVGILSGLALAWSFFQLFREDQKKGFSKLFGWAVGAVVTALVMTPMYLQPHYSSHVSDISAFSPIYTEKGKGWDKILENIVFTGQLFFGQVLHVSRLPAIGDSLYEYMVAACGLLGLSYFVARPRWISTFIASLFLVSAVPGILSNGPHSFRYVACDVPLLIVGAWGVNRLWLAALQVKATQAVNLACALVLLAGLSWEGERNHWLLWQWMGQKAPCPLVWDQYQKEMPDHYVYTVACNPGFYTCGLDILADDSDLHEAAPSNSIDLAPDEKPKDLAILVYGQDKATQQKVEEEFPGVQWNKRLIFWQGPQEVPYLWWADIPYDRIPVGGDAFFHTQRMSGPSWRRRCYGHYGLARGLVIWEDRVVHWNDEMPPPQFTDWSNSMRVVGDWNVTTAGTYTLGTYTPDTLKLYVDGKQVLAVAPGEALHNKAAQVHLDAGSHHVEMAFAFNTVHQVPQVTVLAPGSPVPIPLDDLTASQAPSSPAAAPDAALGTK